MAESVTPLPERVPDTIRVSLTSGFRFTPNELRLLKKQTGRSLTELTGPNADDGDRMQTMVWLRLQRDGHTIEWDACGDIELDVEVPTELDPTSGSS